MCFLKSCEELGPQLSVLPGDSPQPSSLLPRLTKVSEAARRPASSLRESDTHSGADGFQLEILLFVLTFQLVHLLPQLLNLLILGYHISLQRGHHPCVKSKQTTKTHRGQRGNKDSRRHLRCQPTWTPENGRGCLLLQHDPAPAAQSWMCTQNTWDLADVQGL